MAEASERRDGLEPPGVATGRVWLTVAAVFVLLFTALGVMLVFQMVRIRQTTEAEAKPFPFPALETNVAPRLTADRDHGPKPYRELPASERPARAGEPDPRLLAAMREVAARGPAAYDPLPPEGTR